MTTPPEDITAELSLFSIWKKSRAVRKPLGNRVIRWSAFILLTAYSLLPWTSTDSLIASSRHLSSLGLPSVLGLLGFLLAGYTVFISIARRDLLVAMSLHEDPDSGMSWLKVSLYTYIGALAELLVVAVALLVLVVLGQSGGLVASLVAKDSTGLARDIVAGVGFVVSGYALVHTIVLLKITIRNVHHGIAAAIRWDAENDD